MRHNDFLLTAIGVLFLLMLVFGIADFLRNGPSHWCSNTFTRSDGCKVEVYNGNPNCPALQAIEDCKKP